MTIKIYDTQNEERYIEFGNVGTEQDDEIPLTIDDPNSKEYIGFSLSKNDAKEIILYLKKEFHLPLC